MLKVQLEVWGVLGSPCHATQRRAIRFWALPGRSYIPRAPYTLMQLREGEVAVPGFWGLSHLDSSELLKWQSWRGRSEKSIELQLSYQKDMIRAELQGEWQTQGLEGTAGRRRGDATAAVRPRGGCGSESYLQKTNVRPFTRQHDSPVVLA